MPGPEAQNKRKHHGAILESRVRSSASVKFKSIKMGTHGSAGKAFRDSTGLTDTYHVGTEDLEYM